MAPNSSSTCVIAAAREGRQDAIDGTLVPAVESAGLRPVHVTPGRSSEGLRQLHDEVQTATAVLVDLREHDAFCLIVVGAALPVLERLVIIATDASGVPVPIEDHQIVEVLSEPGSSEGYETLKREITDRLVAANTGTSGPTDSDVATPPRYSGVPTDLSRGQAEALMYALWGEGLTRSAVREELLRVGAPPAWVDLRLEQLRVARRHGW